jgi:hypothetical protein
MSDEKPMGQVIQIDEARIRDHLGEMVRGTVEETLNAMLDAEAETCGRSISRKSCKPKPSPDQMCESAASPAVGRRVEEDWNGPAVKRRIIFAFIIGLGLILSARKHFLSLKRK